MPVLDTPFLIALHAHDPAAQARIQAWRAEPLIVPSIVAVEFMTAFGPEAPTALAELTRAFHIVHTTPEWILAASSLRHELRGRRRIVRLADFSIAGFARLHDTFVITRNETDFQAFGVKTGSW